MDGAGLLTHPNEEGSSGVGSSRDAVKGVVAEGLWLKPAEVEASVYPEALGSLMESFNCKHWGSHRKTKSAF